VSDIINLGIVLGLACAVMWSALDAMRKEISKEVSATGLMVGLHLPQVPLLIGLIALGAWRGGPPGEPWTVMLGDGIPQGWDSAEYLVPATISLVFALVANILFLMAVERSPLSLTIPYLSFTPIFSSLGALVLTGESPTTWGWVGIAVVSGGAFLLNPGKREEGLMAPLKALWTERGSLYMLGVALCWSATAIYDQRASGLTSASWHTLMLTLGILGSMVAYRLVRDRSPGPLWDELKHRAGFQIVAGALLLGAMVVQMTAYNMLGVGYVETLKRAVGVVGAIGIGYVVFGESDLGQRLVAAVIISIGVAILILGG